MHINKLTDFLDKTLKSKAIPDASQNGLQVEGRKEVKKIAFGVSASLELFKKAKKWGADTVIVHHGIVWDKPERITGVFKGRVEYLFKNEMNLFAYHLPLDMHPTIGNNAQIVKYLGGTKAKPFSLYNGLSIGFSATLKKALTITEIVKILKVKLKANPLVLAHGKQKVKTVGVVSGGAWGHITDAMEENLDLYITGEPSEPVWELAKEGKINFIATGHYNSEKAGIFALEREVAKKLKVQTVFIDVENPI
jgi:dinuclear metal center YbgI/SA1388 family protein